MYEYRCILEKIVDGDTIDVTIDLGFHIFIHNERIRLYGINTPELRSKFPDERQKARDAMSRLTELLPKEFVIRTILDKRGKYGRVLGTLIVENVNINEQLVTEGHAVVYTP